MIGVDAGAQSRRATELIGFVSSLGERVRRLEPLAEAPRPVVLPSYGGARALPNLTALLALLLRRYGVPVVMHGPVEAACDLGRVTTVTVLWELGIEPAKSMTEAQRRLARERIAYVPISVLAPGLAELLASRRRMGLRGDSHGLVQLIDPFAGVGFRVVGVARADDLQWLREILTTTHADALLLRGTEGEPFADPRQQPQLESFAGGVSTLLFETERDPVGEPSELPDALDASITAAWITAVLEGEQPVPQPIVNQLACCLLATRRTPGAG